MAVIIGHAAIDERGSIAGGVPGDQTGNEVCTRDWWDMGWTELVRPKKSSAADGIAREMEDACRNNFVGYDQAKRLSLYEACRKNNYDIASIAEPCSCDCSSLVAVCVLAAGINVNPDLYTGNEVDALKNTGCFDVYRDDKYLRSADALKRGDILVKQYSHTVIVLSDGSGEKDDSEANTGNVMYAEDYADKYRGTYHPITDLNLRAGAGVDYRILKVLHPDDKVICYGFFTKYLGRPWLYVVAGDMVGFASSVYLRKV